MNTYKYTVNGRDYTVDIEEIDGSEAKVSVNGRPFTIELKKPMRKTVAQKPVHVEAPKPVAVAPAQPVVAPQPKKNVGSGSKVVSPLPGTIVDVLVKEGDTVNQGDTVVILEAMKMQNSIEADVAGTITSVVVKQGDTVMEGEVLVTIE